MNSETLAFLASDTGAALLARLAGEDLSDGRTLALITALRKTYSAEQAGAALEMARVRVKAAEKFGDAASQLFFTRDALEQASDSDIRRYRAALVKGARVVDVCCGIGADSLAFAAAGASVLGVDIDPLRIAIAQHNAAQLGLAADFRIADATAFTPPDCDLIFYDPARRDASGRRIYDVARYLPPLSLITRWHAPRKMVKLSPGVDLDQLAPYDGMVEFISVGGDLKEAVLHLGGDFAGNSVMQPLATLITSGTVYHWRREHPPETRALSAPRAWLIEPDPAILRAGLVEDVTAAFDGWMLDETIAYFTTDTLPESVWVRAWQILDWMPFNLKKLRAYLREHGVGQVTVKKRGSPLTPEELIAKLKLGGKGDSRTLVLTRHAGEPVVLICA